MERQELRRRLSWRAHNVRLEEIEQLLSLSGWSLVQERGSHRHYQKDGERLTAPSGPGGIPAAYVFEVLRRTREEGDDV